MLKKSLSLVLVLLMSLSFVMTASAADSTDALTENEALAAAEAGVAALVAEEGDDVTLGAGLAAIMFFWVCGKKYVEEEVNKGADKPISSKFYAVCKYFFTPVCFLVLILGMLMGGIG